MGRSVVPNVETDRPLVVRLLGAPSVIRAGEHVDLPRSRKVRALLGFLALSPRPVQRSRLCDLLWDVPNDPRGELRWCLSKLRGVLEGRVVATDGAVSLDLAGCRVDALEIDRAGAVEQLSIEKLGELSDLFAGDLLEGVELDGSPEFSGWLAALRNRYRGAHIHLLSELAKRAHGSDETFRRLDAWLQLAPFDLRAHHVMLEALAKSGRTRDAEDHLAATIRACEQQGVEWQPLRDAWQSLREAVPRIEVAAPVVERTRRRASIAVMPFAEGATRSTISEGLAEDVIVQLAKLRVLFVIARGTVFALAERGVHAQEAGRILNVDYVVSGSVRREGSRVTVVVELADVRDGHIVWTDSVGTAATEPYAIVDRIVAAIAEEVETAETQRAILKPPSSLDAWEAYHRGLWHMYKFTGNDNREAAQLFRKAIAVDATFSRAHAGLSFTHFQNAFLDLTRDHDHQIELASATALASIAADDRDPAAHWAMGRALWLRGVQGESVAELQRSIELSPNFALGHYTLGFVHCQSGDPHAAIDASNYSRQLSPFDPLQFAMLASRALAHVRLDEYQEAAEWAVKGASRPNAHTHILAIAAECLALANRIDEARKYMARIRERSPSYRVDDLLRAFRFAPDAATLLKRSAHQFGFD